MKKIVAVVGLIVLGIALALLMRKTGPVRSEIVIKNQIPQNGAFIAQRLVVTEPSFLVVEGYPVADVWAASALLQPGTYTNVSIPMIEWVEALQIDFEKHCNNFVAGFVDDADRDGIYSEQDFEPLWPSAEEISFSSKTNGEACVLEGGL